MSLFTLCTCGKSCGACIGGDGCHHEAFKLPEISPSPFTAREQAVWEGLVSVHNDFVKLMRSEAAVHPSEAKEWEGAIHTLQGLMEHRALKRLYPQIFQ